MSIVRIWKILFHLIIIIFLGLNSPRYLDLNSEPPTSFPSQLDNVNSPLSSMERTSHKDFLPQPSSGMMYRGAIYNIHPPRFHLPEQQQFMYPNQRIMAHSPWNNHQPFSRTPPQQFSHSHMTNQQSQSIRNLSLPSTSESYSHPLESLERLVLLPESQVIS